MRSGGTALRRLRVALCCAAAIALAPASAAWGQAAEPAPRPRCERVETGVKVALRAVWGAKPDAVWAVGAAGVALRWNGVRWLQIPTGTEQELLAIGGVSAKDLWAVGQAGEALHFDGKQWAEVPMGSRHQFSAVVALATDDVWALGQDPGTRRWTDAASGDGVREREDGRRPSASLFHWDGRGWLPQLVGPDRWPPLRAAAAGADGREIWAVGQRSEGKDGRPEVARLKGERWAKEAGPGDSDLAAVFSAGEEIFCAGSRGTLFSRGAQGWKTLDAVDAVYEGLWASGPKDLWAVGSLLRHFDGSAWSNLPVEGGSSAALHAVWGAGQGEVWAVGDEGVSVRCAPTPQGR